MIKRIILTLPVVLAACLPMQVAVVEQSSQAVIDGARVNYNQDYLAVSRGLQPLTNTPQDKAAARQAVSDFCGAQGLGFLDRSVTFSAVDATWRFRGNCVFPDGTPLSQ
jgi:hypothetical protein